MTTTATVADWIKRIADDERRRDAVSARETEIVARKAALVQLHGQQLLDELRATVRRDIDAFRDEFAGDRARDIIMEDTQSDRGFVIRKPESPAVSLTVAPRLEAATVGCHYRFTPRDGLPPREDRFELVFADDGTDTLQIKIQATGRVFTSADALSEYLLIPVFTGRPR
jgi:hypothetical protein